jgi:hypothetical protein
MGSRFRWWIVVASVCALSWASTSADPKDDPRKLSDGSTLRLLGVTYGKEHYLLREGGWLGPGVVASREVGFTEKTERLAVWLRREEAFVGTPWSPWVVLADEHGCRFVGPRWPTTPLPKLSFRFPNGQEVPGTTQVTHNTHGPDSASSSGYGLEGPPGCLIRSDTVDLFPRHTPSFRVWVYDADGARQEFQVAAPPRSIPQDWNPSPLPAKVTADGLTATLTSLVTGLDWDAIGDSKKRGLAAMAPAPWHQAPFPDGEELIPWAQVRYRLSGPGSDGWDVEGVRVEDRWGNKVVYRPIARSERSTGEQWVAFPSSLCEREVAWRVSLLMNRRSRVEWKDADILWKHAAVPLPAPEALSPLPESSLEAKGVKLTTRGLSGPGWGKGVPGIAPQRYYLVGFTAALPDGEAIEPILHAEDQNGREIPSELFFNTTSVRERRYSFQLHPRPDTRMVRLTLGVWKNRTLTALLPPTLSPSTDRFHASAEKARVAEAEKDATYDYRIAAFRGGTDEAKNLVAAMLKDGVDLNKPFRRRRVTPLTEAIGGSARNLDLIQALLDAKANPNALSYSNVPPLITAEGVPEIVRILLKAGADPNLAPSSTTALMAAAANARLETVELLLKAGARVNQRDANGETALKLALHHAGTPKGESMIKMLREAGATE